jgi:hypothetical protein
MANLRRVERFAHLVACRAASTCMNATQRGTLPHLGLSLVGLVAQLDSVSLGHSIERASVDPEYLCRSCPITADRSKHVFEVAALHVLECREIFKESGRCVAAAALQQGCEIVGSND